MPRLSRSLTWTILLALAATQLIAADPQGRHIYVDPIQGDDRATGLTPQKQGVDGPLKTIHFGVRRAKPGDTVHLAPSATAYHESIVLHNMHGESDRPIVVDGHGATITGAEPLNPDECQEISPGLFRNDRLIPQKLVTPEDAVSRRWFFLFDGRINRMGRTLKGRNAPYKKPSDLQSGEWTYQREENAFYIKTDSTKKLANYRIEWPARSAGVQVSGDNAHLVVRNLIATHVYNDGYNIHNKTRDVRFENIQAIECGDDGISAHDDCEIAVDGFVAIGNSTGIANVGASVSTTNRAFIDATVGTDLLFQGSGKHTLTNSVLRCTGAYSLSLLNLAAGEGPCSLKMENVLLTRGGETSPLKVGPNSQFEARHITSIGLSWQGDGKSLVLRDSVIAGPPAANVNLAATIQWTADHNLYDLHALTIGSAPYNASGFAAYQQASGQDAASRWTQIEFSNPATGQLASPVPGVGVEPALLPHL